MKVTTKTHGMAAYMEHRKLTAEQFQIERRVEKLREQVDALRHVIIMLDKKTEFRIIENLNDKIDAKVRRVEEIRRGAA